MQRGTQQLVIVIGNIGSGKSTAVPLVAATLNASTLFADELFQKTDPFALDYLKNTPRWAFTNELWLTVERAKLLKNHLRRARKQITVVDSGLLMSWVYSYSHFATKAMSRHEWAFYQSLYAGVANGLMRKSCVIFLDYPVPTLLKRIKKRGREFELVYYNAKYLSKLQRGLRKLVRLLRAEGATVIHVKESRIKDFENDARDREKFIGLVKGARL